MELIMVRHGLPLRVENNDGPADPPLSPLGHEQAAGMAQWLAKENIDAIYVSPMLRALETAAPLAELTGLDPIVVDGIAEFDRDWSTYIPIEEVKDDKEAWAKMLASNETDTRKTWRDGIVTEMEAIIDANSGRRVAAVCHGGVIGSYLSHVLSIESPMFFEPWYTSIHRVMAASSGERTLIGINESHWLRELGGPSARFQA